MTREQRGWQDRLVPVDNANTNGIRGLCLDPADLAVSKLAAGRPKDLEFVRVLLRERFVTIDALATSKRKNFRRSK